MLDGRDRIVGLVGTILSLVLCVGLGFVATSEYVAISSNRVSSEAPGLILVVSLALLVITLPNLAGWIFLWKGFATGYRVLSLVNGLSTLVGFFSVDHIFILLFLPLAIGCEVRYRTLRSQVS